MCLLWRRSASVPRSFFHRGHFGRSVILLQSGAHGLGIRHRSDSTHSSPPLVRSPDQPAETRAGCLCCLSIRAPRLSNPRGALLVGRFPAVLQFHKTCAWVVALLTLSRRPAFGVTLFSREKGTVSRALPSAVAHATSFVVPATGKRLLCHCHVDVLLSCWRLYRQCVLSRTRSMHDNLDVIEVCDWSDVSELIASGNHEAIETARRALPSASIFGQRGGASFASQGSW